MEQASKSAACVGSLLLILLSGCTVQQRLAIDVAEEEGAQAADAALELNEGLWCNAATNGSVMRRYGPNREKMKARQLICWPDLLNLYEVDKVNAEE